MAGSRKKEFVFFVKHPNHTTVPVIAENWEQATMKAAEFWGIGWGQRRQWHPTPVLLPGKSHGRRSLVGCSPWGR